MKAQKKYTIVLDAGHGGKDGGASIGSYIEKKIVLKVALEVGKELRRNHNIKVVYTRNKDNFVELHKRASIANKNDASLFVSLHCDSFKPNPKAHGASTYVLGLSGNEANMEIAKKENAVILLEDNYKQNYDYDPNSPESVIGLSVLQEENLDQSLAFATMVQSKFIEARRHDRSVKQANFLVLRETVMPSVLIELGFLTNKAEGKFLNSKTGQQKIAKAIANAIIKYVNQLKLNTVQEKVKEITKPIVENKQPKRIVVEQKTKPKTVIQKTSKLDKKTKSTLSSQPVKTIPKKATISYIEFKVQIAASRKYIEPQPYNFKGLTNVDVLAVEEYYKYYYGSSSEYRTIKMYLKDAQEAGVKGAFIVAFENGNKIPLHEAIKKH